MFAKGLNSDVLLILKERLSAVLEGFGGPDFKPDSQKNCRVTYGKLELVSYIHMLNMNIGCMGYA